MSPLRMTRSGDPFDQAILRAGRNEEPPRGAEERALARLGLSAMPPNVAAGPRRTLAVRSAGALKVVVGVSALALVAGAALGLRASRQGSAPAVATVAELPPAIAAPVGAAPALPEREAPALSLPQAPVGGRDPARRSAPHATMKVLPSEVALVQQAAQALASRDAVGALAILDAYDHQWPRGALVEEAGALRVQALARTGRLAEARALARTFLAADPRGVLASRFRRILDGADDADAR